MPSEEQWQALFQTPGYHELITNEIPEPILKQLFTLAFKPSEHEKAAKLIKEEDIRARFILHLRRTQAQQMDLSAFIRSFTERYPENFNDYYRLAKEYLPSDGKPITGLPKISFSYFDNDARAFKNRIVLDPLFALTNESSLKYWIAHEFHHYFSYNLASYQQPEEDTPDEDVIWILVQTQLEGIADLIDKKQIYFQNGFMEKNIFAQVYKEKYEQSAALLAHFDKLFQGYGNKENQQQTLANQIKKSLPMSGHPTGYYMAEVIEQYVGREALISSIGNPFKFFKLYQSAALNQEIFYQFSDQTMYNIELLERKYSIK